MSPAASTLPVRGDAALRCPVVEHIVDVQHPLQPLPTETDDFRQPQIRLIQTHVEDDALRRLVVAGDRDQRQRRGANAGGQACREVRQSDGATCAFSSSWFAVQGNPRLVPESGCMR